LLWNANGFRFQRKLPRLLRDYGKGGERRAHALQSVQSWLAHASHADTFGLRRSLLERTPFETLLPVRSN
jgi:RNA-directed DNA polymerase